MNDFATITGKLGVHVTTTTHKTQRAAELAAKRAIKSGAADSAAVWTGGPFDSRQVAVFGRGL